MEASYLRVEVARDAAAPLSLIPAIGVAVTKAFDSYLYAEYAYEKAIEIYWKKQSGIWQWELAKHCGIDERIRASAFPEFPFELVSPSSSLEVSEQTRYLQKTDRPELSLIISSGTLMSHAKIEWSQREWKAYWDQ